MEQINGIKYTVATGDRMVFTGVQYVILEGCAICGETIAFRFLECDKETFWKNAEDADFLALVADVFRNIGWLIDMDKKICRCPDCKDKVITGPDIPQAQPISKELEKAIRRIDTNKIERITKGVNFKKQQKEKYNPFSEF